MNVIPSSGIGRGLAEHCAQKGMKIVLADVEEEALSTVESEMRTAGADITAVVTDLARIEDVQAVAQKTIDA